MKQLLQEVKIDVANVHNLGPQITWSILSLLKDHEIPIVWTMHDFGILCPNSTFVSNGTICEKCRGGKFYQCTLNKCKKNSYLASMVSSLKAYVDHYRNVQKYIDVFICPSKFQMAKFIEFGFDQKRLVHMYNPYDVNELLKISTNDNVPYSNYILYVGRLEKIKGILSLLKVMQDIKHVDLVVIGSGDEERTCKDFIRDRNLSNVHLLGQLDKTAVIPFIKNCLFTICPSECYENLPYSVVEAMLLGKPVIGSEIGGIPELVIDGYSGLTFKSGDKNDLREKIETLILDNATLRQYGNNARQHVSQMVKFDAYYKNIENIIRKLGVN